MSLRMRSVLALAVGTVLGLTLSLGTAVRADRQPLAQLSQPLPTEDVRLFAEVLERVRTDYVDEIDEHTLIEGAVRSMVAGLDPYSAFLDSAEYQEVRISTAGQYSGIGVEVVMQDGQVTIVSPIDSGPAARAGIQSGDVILSIDGAPVSPDKLDDTISRMRGEPGTSMVLGIRGSGSGEIRSLTLARELIQVASVKARSLEPGFGYIRITHFSETTGRDLERAAAGLLQDNGGRLKGLVLDLRNNPGGLLDAAVRVSDLFLERGLIVSAEGRVDDARFSMSAQAGDLLDGQPLVVLVNNGSASASEIVAGALHDNGRAVLVGSHTFGKGSVQTVMPLSNGRAIKLTTSRYFTPSGASIHEVGIKPDVEVLREVGDSTVITPSGIPIEVDDPVLVAAIKNLKDRQPILQSKAQ
ncbi:MAG: S41 family peptidase [Gammaproteobacteria bacterium]|nr:S41 family peptidase [Gammaproteobacteria bacterium]